MDIEQDDGEIPRLTSVVVVCREFPRVVAYQRVMRRIEEFVDCVVKYPIIWMGDRSIPLWVVKRSYAYVGWDKKQVRKVFQEAAGNGRLDIVQWLTNRGASINQQDENGQTPLHKAVSRGCVSVVEWLVSSGAFVDILDGNGQTPLHEAARNGQFSVVQFLITKTTKKNFHNAEVSTYKTLTNFDGQTALHWAVVSFPENLWLVKLLVDSGLEPFDTDRWERTALDCALLEQHFEIVRYFLTECSTEVKPPHTALRHVLFTAASAGLIELMVFLAEKFEVDLNYVSPHGRTALHEAAVGGAIHSINLLLQGDVDVSPTDTFGVTPIVEACRYGHLSVVHRLLNAGASVNDMNLAGQTALHYAAKGGHKQVVAVLLKYDADINCSDQRGWTPLHYAAAGGHMKVLSTLIGNGANVAINTSTGKCAATIAVECGCFDASKYLEKKGSSGDKLVFQNPLADGTIDILDPTETDLDSHNNMHYAQGFWLDAPIEAKVRERGTSKNFYEELNRRARLNHPHIIELYGVCFGVEEYDPFFVYEQPPVSLREYLDLAEETVSHAVIWSKLYQAALGLQYLHDRHMIHGAISCSTIAIAANEAAKLRDFGSENTRHRRNYLGQPRKNLQAFHHLLKQMCMLSA